MLTCGLCGLCGCACAAEANAALIRADKLQRLHTLANLAQLLGCGGDTRPPGVPPTLRDDRLPDLAQAVRSVAQCSLPAVAPGRLGHVDAPPMSLQLAVRFR